MDLRKENVGHGQLGRIKIKSRNSQGFNPSILGHSGILRAADEAVLNKVRKNMLFIEPRWAGGDFLN